MLDIDWGRLFFVACCGSRWRVRIIDNFRRMMLGYRSREQDRRVGIGRVGDIDARERLYGVRTRMRMQTCGRGSSEKAEVSSCAPD